MKISPDLTREQMQDRLRQWPTDAIMRLVDAAEHEVLGRDLHEPYSPPSWEDALEDL